MTYTKDNSHHYIGNPEDRSRCVQSEAQEPHQTRYAEQAYQQLLVNTAVK